MIWESHKVKSKHISDSPGCLQQTTMWASSAEWMTLNKHRHMFNKVDDVRLTTSVVHVYNQLNEYVFVPNLIETNEVYC